MDPQELEQLIAQAKSRGYQPQEIQQILKSKGIDWTPPAVSQSDFSDVQGGASSSAPPADLDHIVGYAKAQGYKPKEIQQILKEKGIDWTPPDTDINLHNLARSAVQGATFNFGDELLGKLPEALGGGERARDEMRANDAAFRSEHPYVSGAAEIAGGLAVPGFGAVKAIKPIATTLRGTMATGAALGGVSGALSGAGSAEGDIGDRIKPALKAGALGAAAGAVLPGVVGAAKAAYDPATRATARLGVNIKRSGGVKGLLDVLDDFKAAGKGDDVMLADLSDPMRQAADFAANNSETAAEQIGKAAYGRQADQSERILNDARNVVGDPRADQITEDLQKSTQRWAEGPSGFGGLRQQNPVIQPQNAQAFGKLLNSSGVKGPWEQAREVGLIGPMPEAGPISFETLQGTKERMDAAVDGAFNRGLGDLGRRLGAARDAVVAEMKQSVPGYQSVAAEYHGRKGLERMVEAGQDAFRQADTRGLRQQVSGLNAGELAKFREGMASEMITKLRGTATNRDLSKQLVDASPAMKDKMEIVFGSQKAAGEFMEKMRLEREMARLMRTVQGSETAKRLAAREGIDPLELGVDMAVSPGRPVAQVLRALGKKVGVSVGNKTGSRLAPQLTTRGAADIEALLREWQKNPNLLGIGMGQMAPIGSGLGAGLLLDQDY